MGVIALPLVLLLAWVLAVAGVTAPGGNSGDDFAVNAMLWMLALPVGGMFIVSGLMHTVLAKKTAKSIGWQTNGFQYELGFVSLGIGIAGIVASGTTETAAWLVLSIVVSVFLVGAAINHIIEIVRDKNYAPGNTIVVIYDLGLPISLWALLFIVHAF